MVNLITFTLCYICNASYFYMKEFNGVLQFKTKFMFSSF